MELIKLLDVANPKLIKDTLNRVSQDYETFRTEIEEAANAALNTAVTASDTANTALTTVTDYEAVVMESAQDSSSARLVAEEALAMITQADERSQEAALLAEQSFTEASEAVQTSELAMNVANEAKSTVDQALDIGTLGSFVHNIHGIALAHAHMTDDPNQADDEELSYLATPTLVREAIKDKADLTNDEQEIRAGTLNAKKLQIKTGVIEFDDSANTFWTGSNLNIGGNLNVLKNLTTKRIDADALYVCNNGELKAGIFSLNGQQVRFTAYDSELLLSSAGDIILVGQVTRLRGGQLNLGYGSALISANAPDDTESSDITITSNKVAFTNNITVAGSINLV